MLNRGKKSDKYCNNASDNHLYDASKINSVASTTRPWMIDEDVMGFCVGDEFFSVAFAPGTGSPPGHQVARSAPKGAECW